MIMRWLAGRPRENAQRELANAGFRYALALTHDRTRAEDLVQQAWLRLLEAYGQVNDRPRLFLTIKNLVRDDHRRDRLHAEAAIELADPVPTEITTAGEPPVGDDLDRLLARLTPREREVLYLNAVEGYTAAEIAAHMGAARGSVLSLAARAKAKLRRHVGEEACDARPE